MNLNRELSSKAKKIVLISAVSIVGILAIIFNFPTSAPKLIVNSPANNAQLMDAEQADIQGTVSPAEAMVYVNHSRVVTDAIGNFTYRAPLKEGDNTVPVMADYKGKSTATDLRITVTLSSAEKERRRLAEEQKKKDDEVRLDQLMQKQKLADAEYAKTPAGKICLANPKWSREDCARLANKEVWVGMSTEMIIFLNGKHPDVLNQSNYGSGDRWQVCWFSKTPSCFYDNDNDGLVDSYN